MLVYVDSLERRTSKLGGAVSRSFNEAGHLRVCITMIFVVESIRLGRALGYQTHVTGL